MNNVPSGSGKEKIKVFETLLSSPGMNEKCKVNMSLSRQAILLFCRLVELGFGEESALFADDIMPAFSQESMEELMALKEELLKKGALVDFYQRFKVICEHGSGQ